ncbi:N4-gp56 family major capsid protein [Streptomyces bohaiensis]|uniref:N4-gp56 family major capsid protein n=1 Tax=Streptomyces bohaiensis TaxID=1431344 RepID=UPI003B7B6F65
MAITNFVPEIWSAELLVELEKAHVYGAAGVVNRDYEGEIANAGDTVHITSLVEPTIGDYTPHEDIEFEQVDDEDLVLTIDQSKFFGFTVDDVEKRQALRGGAVLSEQARKAAYKLRDVSDIHVATLMSAGVAPGNLISGAALTDPGDAYELLVDLDTVLSESDVPHMDRWVVVSPKFYGLLKKDNRFVATGDAAAVATRANGRVGEASGFSIRVSNNVPLAPGEDGGRRILAGYGGAVTYAEQINKVESARKEKGFADLVKGLHLYGSRVIRPTGLAAADVVI